MAIISPLHSLAPTDLLSFSFLLSLLLALVRLAGAGMMAEEVDAYVHTNAVPLNVSAAAVRVGPQWSDLSDAVVHGRRKRQGATGGRVRVLTMGAGLLATVPPLYGYEPLCPSTCGLDRAVGYFIAPGSVDTSSIFDLIGTPGECAALCAPTWNYYLWKGPSSSLAYRCSCFLGCHNVKVGSDEVDANFFGVAPLCPGVPTPAPGCPGLLEVSPNGVMGVPASDPAVVSSILALLPSPLQCRDFCLANAPSATSYQWAASDTFAGNFTYGDCFCLSYCPSSRFTAFSPMTFYLGSLCAALSAPTVCSPSNLPNVLPPLPGTSGIACSAGTTSLVHSGADSVLGVQYSCQLCNPEGAPGDIVDYVATVSNFVPLSSSGITPAGLIFGVVNPSCCIPFSYTNPLSLGPASFTTFLDPYHASAVAVLPPSFGTAGTPASAFQLALGPCTLTGTSSNSWSTLFSYSCTILNTSPNQMRSISLSCPSFNPVSVSGINVDCTISKVLAPGGVCTFGFQTLDPYAGPLAVTGYTTFRGGYGVLVVVWRSPPSPFYRA